MEIRTASALLTALTFVLGGCAGATHQVFQYARPSDGSISTVTLSLPLPDHDTGFVFREGENGFARPLTYEVAGAFECHWSDLIVICRTGASSPPEAMTNDGRYVRRLADGTVLVANRSGGHSGDFARYDRGRLVAFGAVGDEGVVRWRYDRTAAPN